MRQHGKGGVKFSSGGTASVVASHLEPEERRIFLKTFEVVVINLKSDLEDMKLAVANLEKGLEADKFHIANLEEKVKTLEMTVNDIRWGREHPK